MNKYKIFNQFEEYDCAAGAVAMYIHCENGKSTSISELKILLNTTQDGTSFKDVYTVIKNYGYKSNIIKCEKDIDVFDEMPLPAITQMQFKDNVHYITIFKITKKHIIYGDPLKKEVQKVKKKKFSTNWIPYIVASAESKKDKSDNINVREDFRTMDYVKTHKKFILTSGLLSVVVYLFTLVLAGMYTLYFDILIPNKVASLLVNFFFLYLAFVIFQLLLNIIKSKIEIKYSNSLDSKLINILVSNFLGIKYSVVSRLEKGELVTRFSSIADLRNRIISLSQTIPINIVIIITTISILLSRNMYLTVLIFVPLIIYYLIYLFTQEKYSVLSTQMYNHTEDFNNDFIETLDNVTTIKSYGMEDDTTVKLQDKLKKLLKTSEKFHYYDAILTTIRNSLIDLFSIMLFSVGAYLIIIDNISQGVFLMFNALTQKVFNPFIEIVNLQADLQQGVVSKKRLEDLILASKEDLIGYSESNVEPLNKLEIKNLSYSYNKQSEILQDVNITIHNGEKIAIIGMNGSGKTTFGKIVSGLLLDYEGLIEINGGNYKNLSAAKIRSNVSYITENVDVFTGTIKENLLFNNSIKEEGLIDVTKETGLDSIVTKLPDGYNTIIGKGGVSLSKGQMQILNITRGFSKSANLHIYDEATSGLDYQNKIKVERFLLRDKTCKLFITHDLLFAAKCDRVFIMRQGSLEEVEVEDVTELQRIVEEEGID